MADSADSTENDNQENDRSAQATPGPTAVLRKACAQLSELTGQQAESVTSFVRTEDGWSLEVEVVELERVPSTASLLATYEVSLDRDHELSGYRRVRRYERGRADPR
ncbi:gas vesicle protein GvpO [Streptomyces sp. NPDC001985]|uniref:gas vesicle protein GvpO n=1 Tax=Streptomyces sp. NPDC001985 TaxID=3154406 RepID=UPI00332C12E4